MTNEAYTMDFSGRCITAVFTRVPIPGATKTRLQKRIAPEECAALHKAMLLDMIEGISPACSDLVLCYSDEWRQMDDGDAILGALIAEVRGVCCDTCTLHSLAQTGEDLGSRMINAMATLFESGASKCLLTGSDIPGITAADIQCACDALDSCDVVFGPGEDGGYWLVGAREDVPSLFQGRRFSTSNVLDDAIATCRALGKDVTLCRTALDIDEPQDLDRLIAGNVPMGRRTASIVARLRPSASA